MSAAATGEESICRFCPSGGDFFAVGEKVNSSFTGNIDLCSPSRIRYSSKGERFSRNRDTDINANHAC